MEEATGNSNSLRTYEYEDDDLKPLAYYRLKIVDLDGSIEYSHTIALVRDVAQNTIAIYPNPINEWLIVNASINPSTKLEIKIYDSVGRVVFSKEPIVNSSGQWNAKIDSSHLPSGMYMIQFINGNTSETMKLIKE